MGLLSSFHFNTLASPWFLVLLPVTLLLVAIEMFARPAGALSFSTAEHVAALPGRHGSFRRFLPPLLRGIALACLILALARPLLGIRPQADRANVVDIALCVDVSKSMAQRDFSAGGRQLSRLAVTKTVVQDFVESRKNFQDERFGLDRIGLVLYAGYGWTQCPLTLDYGVLEHELARAHINNKRDKAGTAIGSAIGLAVSRLRKSEAKSKVIILLTDGQNNRGELDPITAALLAKDFGIRIYTIGAGSATPQRVGGFFGGVSEPIDEDTLRRIAEKTGGKYYRATDTEALQQAYAEISELEATEIEIGDYYEYKEGFLSYALLGTALLIAAHVTKRRYADPVP